MTANACLRAAYALVILVALTAAAATQATCIDYDLVLPIVGEAGGVTELIAVDVLGSWAFAIDKTAGPARSLAVFSIHDPEAPILVATAALPNYAYKIVCADSRAYVITWSYGVSELAVSTFRLGVAPNPFNPQTVVRFALDRPQWAEVAVYDLAGRRLAVLAGRDFAAGEHKITWNGTDARARSIPSGTYLIRLETEDEVQAVKVSLVR